VVGTTSSEGFFRLHHLTRNFVIFVFLFSTVRPLKYVERGTSFIALNGHALPQMGIKLPRIRLISIVR